MPGQFGNVCLPVPKPLCAYTFSAADDGALNWDAATSKGPVIYSLTSTAGEPGVCATGRARKTLRVTLKAYTEGNAWPATSAQLATSLTVLLAGETLDVSTLLDPTGGYVVTGNILTLALNFCVAPATDSIEPGFYFADGNAACATLQ